jgi:hypothetical protein
VQQQHVEQLYAWCGSASGKSAGPGNTIVDFKRVREKKGEGDGQTVDTRFSPTTPFFSSLIYSTGI